MATSSLSALAAPQRALEDPLAHLPCSSIVEYRKGQMIYNQDQPSTSIYLVIDGKVKVSRLADDGHQVVVDIYQGDEFFGESAFLNLPHRSEQATALENTKLMTWSTADIEDIVMKRPRLAVALLQILVQRTIDFTHRIESFSRQHRPAAGSLADPVLGTSGDPGGRRLHPYGAFYARTAVAICRHFARDRDPLHEPVPQAGVPPLFAQGHHSVSRRLPRMASPELLTFIELFPPRRKNPGTEISVPGFSV